MKLKTALQHAEIAHMLEKLGDYECALEQYEECLAIQVKLLGWDHEDCATSWYRIGCLLARTGNWDEACMELQKCFAVRRLLFGRDHPSTLEALESIEAVMKLAIAERERTQMHRERLGYNYGHERLGYGHHHHRAATTRPVWSQ